VCRNALRGEQRGEGGCKYCMVRGGEIRNVLRRNKEWGDMWVGVFV